MNPPLSGDNQGTPTRPYLIRALHDWCTDNGFTPYLAVYVDASVQVPMEYVKNHEIVLNVGFEATSGLKLGNEFVEFKARFGGVGRDIVVPVDHVVAIYARENGQGMAFPAPTEATPTVVGPADGGRAGPRGLRLAGGEDDGGGHETTSPGANAADDRAPEPPTTPAPPSGPRPSLKRVK